MNNNVIVNMMIVKSIFLGFLTAIFIMAIFIAFCSAGNPWTEFLSWYKEEPILFFIFGSFLLVTLWGIYFEKREEDE